MILATMQVLVSYYGTIWSYPLGNISQWTNIHPPLSLPAVPGYSVLKKLYQNKLVVFQELKKDDDSFTLKATSMKYSTSLFSSIILQSRISPITGLFIASMFSFIPYTTN